MIQISSLTSVITINFKELLLLYSYKIPYITILTMPVSFFLALIISLSKLSSENELIVITSFGLNPLKMINILIVPILLFIIFLLFLSIVFLPRSYYLNDLFIQSKKVEAKFNIKPSEFGQSFGKWLIFIEEEKDGKFLGIKLYNNVNSDKFILSDEANIINKNLDLNLVLINGKSFNYNRKLEELEQINFKKMYINNTLNSFQIEKLQDLYTYWIKGLKEAHNLTKIYVFHILNSFFPLISILFIISFGYYNPRYQKNRAVVYGIVVTIFYYAILIPLVKKYKLEALYFVPVWILFSYIVYLIRVKRVF